MAINTQNPIGLNLYQQTKDLKKIHEKAPGLEKAQQNVADNPVKAQAEARLKEVSEKIAQGDITPENIREQTQAALVLHLFGQGEKAADIQKSLQLTYQAAIDKLNEILKPEFGENAISEEKLQAVDPEYWNPKNTANRIVGGATAMFKSYQDLHPEDDLETQLNNFMDLINQGIDQGFADAKDILSGLKVFDNQVKDTFEQTYEEVQKQLEEFRKSILNPEGENQKAEGTEDKNKTQESEESAQNNPPADNPAQDKPQESPQLNIQA